MVTLGVRHSSGIAALSITLAVGILATPIPAGGSVSPSATTGDFSVTVTPSESQVGVRDSYTVVFANAPSSSNSIGSAQIVVPAAFASVQLGSLVEPSGFTSRIATCSSDSPPGCGSPGTTLIEVATPDKKGAKKVLPGKSLKFSVSAIPVSKGTFTWTSAAKNSASWSTGQVLARGGSDPSVRVLGAPAQLSFSNPPPSPVSAGGAFATDIDVLDSDGDPTLSDAHVTLSAPGLQGANEVDAVEGRATATNLALTQAGSVTVTASSPGLTSATAEVLVRPGPPASITVDADSAASAGEAFGAEVSIVDRFGNVVDTPQTATVTRAASGSVPAETMTESSPDGMLQIALIAPTTPGSYRYTVTSGALPAATFDVEVEAGSPVVVTIDSVVPHSGGSVLAKDQPFDVALTTRDAFGNPASYTGTVSLSTSGGVGPALGSLAAPAVSFDHQSHATASGATYSGYGNTITLRAQATDLLDGTRSLNINLFATTKQASPGQGVTVDLGGCQDATPEVPVCSSLLLSHGAVGTVTVAQGECDPFTPCLKGPQNEALLFDGQADLTDGTRDLYTRRDPAMIELRCDKTLCGGSGVSGFPLLFQETGWEPTRFVEAPACPSKGRVGANQTFCQDFRLSHRDNAGDLIAYLLFLNDAKATFK